ncbi:hypothetical protein A3J23_02820 [Candidatus Peregrinibacteria bacterium RIFCSPLOWO2_02_FULL_48_14]|nr:MAG: hypothetical protein A3J23_02820 [Candidatus Peregrinibacteria bacterium RIFCSPLOWO2_02_FULL_48_14]
MNWHFFCGSILLESFLHTIHAMLFNPFKYQYETSYLNDEDNSAVLLLRKGSLEEKIRLPKTLLPLDAKPGDHFILNLQSPENAQQTEAESLKKLLEELTR